MIMIDFNHQPALIDSTSTSAEVASSFTSSQEFNVDETLFGQGIQIFRVYDFFGRNSGTPPVKRSRRSDQ
jgi:hypothetical protein